MTFNYTSNIFARTGDLNTVPSDDNGTSISYAQGFNQSTDISIASGGLAIDRGQLNTVFNVIFQGLSEIQQYGGLLWRSDTEYVVGSEVMYLVGTTYNRFRSLRVNTGVAPNSDANTWLNVTYYAPFPTSSADMQIGSVIATTMPVDIADTQYPNYVLADGSEYPRLGEYQGLYSLCLTAGILKEQGSKKKTEYGTGDGTSTFTIPDFRSVMVAGAYDSATDTLLSTHEYTLTDGTGRVMSFVNYYIKYK